ncbi:MAG: hypothetical protein FJ294_14345 [Planctomycetes bacterium]|nr:hypothetical protein [Planctomycetota bacterium]
MSSPGEDSSVHTGRWIEIRPPSRLSFTWSHTVDHDSLVIIDLTDTGAGTELVLVYEELLPEMSELFEHGWAQCLGYLARALGEHGSGTHGSR